jgi:hypothetical protein
MTVHFISGIKRSFAALRMTGAPASAHDVNPDNIVILSAAKDLSSSVGMGTVKNVGEGR